MNKYWLGSGSHISAAAGRCAMEWVAYVAGEPHSDHPICVSPMLRDFCITLNDNLPDDQRQRMRPYLARCIGTAGDGLDDARRWMCADWLIREYTPTWLELVPALAADASALRALPPVLAMENVQRAMVDLNRSRQDAAAAWDVAWVAARAAARAAAGAAAGDAAWAAAAAGDVARAAAGDAAWAAAGDVVRDIAWAAAGDVARAAAGAAAGAAAWAAAGDVAWAAARAALSPTVAVLQDSVLSPGGLLDRMLPLEPIQVPPMAEWHELTEMVA